MATKSAFRDWLRTRDPDRMSYREVAILHAMTLDLLTHARPEKKDLWYGRLCLAQLLECGDPDMVAQCLRKVRPAVRIQDDAAPWPKAET